MTEAQKWEILQNMTRTVDRINNKIKIAYPGKNLFKNKNRSPIGRIKKQRAKVYIIFQLAVFNFRCRQIMSRRIDTPTQPSFAKGGIVFNGNEEDALKINPLCQRKLS